MICSIGLIIQLIIKQLIKYFPLFGAGILCFINHQITDTLIQLEPYPCHASIVQQTAGNPDQIIIIHHTAMPFNRLIMIIFHPRQLQQIKTILCGIDSMNHFQLINQHGGVRFHHRF